MSAVMRLARARLRRRWPTLVTLGLLGGVVGATVTGALVGGRRTDTAYSRMLAEIRPPDAVVVLFGDTDPTPVARIPDVRSSWTLRSVVARIDGNPVQYISIGAGPPPPAGEFHPLLVRGRLPRSADEVLVNADLPVAGSIPLNKTFPLTLLTPDDFDHFGTFGEPHGPHVDVRVTGVARVGASINSAALLAGPAFAARYAGAAGGGSAVAVRLRNGLAAVPDLQRQLLQLYPVPPGAPAAFEPFQIASRAAEAQAVQRATNVAVQGLIAFAIVAGLAGIVALIQACARYTAAEADDEPTLAALGATASQRIAALVWPGVVVSGLLAAGITAAGGILASPLSPIGSARQFEPHPGVAVNAGLVALASVGIVVVVAACLGIAALPAVRRSAAKRGEPLRPSTVVRRLVRAGAPAPAVVGSRFALEPGGGGLAVPTRTAFAAAVLGALGLVATTAIAGSLQRVSTTPTRYGAPGDAKVSDVTDDVVARLNADRRLGSVLVVRTAEVLINGEPLNGIAVDEHTSAPRYPVLSGRAPAGAGEVALGPAALQRTRTHLGDTVVVGDPAAGRRADVVGEMLAITDTGDSYDQSAVMPLELLNDVKRGAGFRDAYITVAPGADRAQVLADLGRDLEVDDLTTPPTPIAHLDQLRSMLGWLAIFLGVLGVVALAHAVSAAGRRRRRELGVLRAVGFTPRQSVLTLASMSLVIAAIGAAVGMVFGVIAGKAVWRAMAEGVHVAPDLRVPYLALLLTIPVAAAAAALVASVPGWRAARMDVADVLRAE
ncbi:MAG: FtsX-like permease family protein [Acidimicrobiia bacterium]|nr:FtsX-like permease family protein [Acidimicrobiia bacterium]